MNSIFIRIYVGIVLSAILVVASTWGVVEIINQYRADQYRESMAQGVFYVISRGVARQSEDKREERVKLVSRLMGQEFELLSQDQVQPSLSDTEIDKLNDGRVIVRMIKGTDTADIIMSVPDVGQLLKVNMTKVSEQQAKATALFVLDELSQYQISNWDQAFEDIQTQFSFPVYRIAKEKLVLDQDQLARLNRNEIVVALTDQRKAKDSGVSIYAPIGNTGEILVLGPLKLLDWYPVEILLIASIVDLFLIGFIGFILMRPLERKLRSLGLALSKMQAGDLHARAEVEGADEITELAATFNGMSEHISRLIESQREMTRAVSHELRTPVARIRFGIEMMLAIDDQQQRENKADEIDKDIEQLDELIDEILTYARLEEGSPTLNTEELSLSEIFQRIESELVPMSGEINIQTSILGAKDMVVEAEERYIHRVLQNLVTNALKYARGQIEVVATRIADQCYIVVSDDGPGIPETDWEKVFTPFARLDDSRSRASGGYGLGLSIVQRIAQWHSGSVAVGRSELGGAKFTFIIPMKQSKQHALS